jgi:hypothetical protein
MVHWGENFRTNTVGGVAMRDALLTRGRLDDGEELSYALGLIHGEHRGLATVFHGGSWGGYVAEFLRFPDQGYGVAVLCNRSDADPPALALEVAEVHLAGEMDPLPSGEGAPPSVSPGQAWTDVAGIRPLETYAGSYRAEDSGAIVTIEAEDGVLRVLEPGRFDLVPHSADEFEVVGTPASIRLLFEAGESTNAPATRVTVMVAGNVEGVHERVSALPLTADRAAEFAGTYRSPELASSLTVGYTDTALRLELPSASPILLRNVGGDEFAGGRVSLRFTRNASGSVAGLALSQGRIRGIVFDRDHAAR